MSSCIGMSLGNLDCSTNLSLMAENLFFEHDLGKIQEVQALVEYSGAGGFDKIGNYV